MIEVDNHDVLFVVTAIDTTAMFVNRGFQLEPHKYISKSSRTLSTILHKHLLKDFTWRYHATRYFSMLVFLLTLSYGDFTLFNVREILLVAIYALKLVIVKCVLDIMYKFIMIKGLMLHQISFWQTSRNVPYYVLAILSKSWRLKVSKGYNKYRSMVSLISKEYSEVLTVRGTSS